MKLPFFLIICYLNKVLVILFVSVVGCKMSDITTCLFFLLQLPLKIVKEEGHDGRISFIGLPLEQRTITVKEECFEKATIGPGVIALASTKYFVRSRSVRVNIKTCVQTCICSQNFVNLASKKKVSH